MTVRELTTQLGDDLTRLLRDEITLAKAELFASARQAVLGAGILAGALVAGLTSWLALVAAAIAGIAARAPGLGRGAPGRSRLRRGSSRADPARPPARGPAARRRCR